MKKTPETTKVNPKCYHYIHDHCGRTINAVHHTRLAQLCAVVAVYCKPTQEERTA